VPVLLMLAVLAPGCTTPQPEKHELVIALPAMPLTLMPHRQAENLSFLMQSNLFEGLAGFDSDMKLVPLLAASWENPDPLTWLFRLRGGVTFHDGSPLTADDVVFSILRARDDPASVLRSNCATIAAVTREDDHTVRVVTSRPHPVLLQKLRTVFIMPRRYLERTGEDAFARRPVGTGPYRLAIETPGREIRLAAYEAYWGDPPDFAAARFIQFETPDELEALIRNRRLDIAENIPPGVAASLAARPVPGMEVIPKQGLMIRYLGLDTRVAPFDDLRVRRALALAVNRPALVARLLHGYGSPANQFVSPAVFGYNPGLPALPYDPAGARRLLAEAGHPDGVELNLLVPRNRADAGEMLRQQMAPAGIRLRIDLKDREEFFRLVDSTSTFFLLGSFSTTGDASDLFDDLFHSPSEHYGRDNRGCFVNPEIDRLIEILNGHWSHKQRLAALQDIMVRVMAEMPRVPLYAENIIYVKSADLDFTPRVDTFLLANEIRRKQ
jgi:peptide/nickel transport system substrate-binding protein